MKTRSNKVTLLAYYLPQYHPIAENNEWWGQGFTEWTNVAKAQPLFNGHEQPKLPADLGFYDLRVPEVRDHQAQLAKQYGIDGFIYYHYWFGNGKVLLERPAQEMLREQQPDFPFCFCWANQTWKGIWHGLDNPSVLMEQTYPGEDDYRAHFNYLLPFFSDNRYIKVDGKPMFHLYEAHNIPDLLAFTRFFNNLAIYHGFPGIYFVANYFNGRNIKDFGLDALVGMDMFFKMRYNGSGLHKAFFKDYLFNKIRKRVSQASSVTKKSIPRIYDYSKAISMLNGYDFPNDITYFPCLIPNWDNSPRSGRNSMIFVNANPVEWKRWLKETIQKMQQQEQPEKFIVIKSWNEWAEGNYLEPDRKWGHRWLEAVKEAREEAGV